MFAIICTVLALNAAISSAQTAEKPIYNGELALQGEFPDVVKTPINYGDDALPASWDWRTFGYMTTDLNQHIPVYWYEYIEVFQFR